MTPERIESVLGDFRRWLTEMGNVPSPAAAPDPIDLATIVTHFTALRHEVNLQTRSTRALVDQHAEALRLLASSSINDGNDASLTLAKTLIEVTDALTAALGPIAASRNELETLTTSTEPEPKPGFWARLLGRSLPAPTFVTGLAKVRSILDGLADGYLLSLKRIERTFPALGLEPFDTVGQPFDPETMEVIEVVAGNGVESGKVVEEVRRGYRRAGAVYRFALVKVAR